nr:unnamed protein product [Callosobruchus analis]
MSIITKAVKEQLRPWPVQWISSVDMKEMLEFMETEDDSEEEQG